MKSARDPQHGDLLTVGEYADRYGSMLDGKGNQNTRPKLLCPACSFGMHSVAEFSPQIADAIFAHDRGTLQRPAPWCVLKESASWKYMGLTPAEPDVEYGQRLRESFLLNWQKHWAIICNRVEYPDILVFIKNIRAADRVKLWEHRELTEPLVPYLLMAMVEFAPPPGYLAGARSYSVRFRFDGTVRTVEDLWIRTTGDFRMLKVSYLAPTPPETVASQPIGVEDVHVNLEFLSMPIPPNLRANGFQVKEMAKNFKI